MARHMARLIDKEDQFRAKLVGEHKGSSVKRTAALRRRNENVQTGGVQTRPQQPSMPSALEVGDNERAINIDDLRGIGSFNSSREMTPTGREAFADSHDETSSINYSCDDF